MSEPTQEQKDFVKSIVMTDFYHTRGEAERLFAARERDLAAKVEALTLERDDFERKGIELCQAFGHDRLDLLELRAHLERAREALTETKRDLNKFRQHTDQCSRVSCSPDCQGAGLVLVMKNIESALTSLRSGQGTSAEVCSECGENPRIGIGAFAEFCRPCVNRPCGNCGDEGHAKWECVLPPEGTSAEVKPPAPSKPRPIGPDYYDAPTSPPAGAIPSAGKSVS